MASNEVSANNNEDQCTTVAPSGSSIYYVPDDLIQNIFQHLSASDLCHVASCSRWLRDATNQNSLWFQFCQSRGWERYGTTTDLAKIASYGPSEQATGANEASHCSVTFKNDRIVTDDNTAGLTSTCRWKGVYMRAYHLERNWDKNRTHLKHINFDMSSYRVLDAVVDGDLLAISENAKSIHVYDIRKDTLQCVIGVPLIDDRGVFKVKDGVMVVTCRDSAVRAFDAKTGQELNVMNGCRNSYKEPLFFDGELVITRAKPKLTYIEMINAVDFGDIYVLSIQDGTRRTLTVDALANGIPNCCHDVDYRDKMVAAAHNDGYARAWDARSGECLHKLTCQGDQSRVKLGDNVIACVSQNSDMTWLASIWRQDTGECQAVISLPYDSACAMDDTIQDVFVVNGLIVLQGTSLHKAFDPDSGSVYACKLSGEFASALEVGNVFPEAKYVANGSKRPLYVIEDAGDFVVRGDMCIFNATPNFGLQPLFFLDRTNTPDDFQLMWMDEIRMILFEKKKKRFSIHHYW